MCSACICSLSLNIADKGFPISVYNRSYEKTEAAVARAQKEGAGARGLLSFLFAVRGRARGSNSSNPLQQLGSSPLLMLSARMSLAADTALHGWRQSVGFSDRNATLAAGRALPRASTSNARKQAQAYPEGSCNCVTTHSVVSVASRRLCETLCSVLAVLLPSPPTPNAHTYTPSHTPPNITSPGLGDKLTGYKDIKDFVASLEKPR